MSWLLDTNIVSEAMRPRPEVAVMENLARYEGELAIPAPVWHELRFGWLRMPDGQRKDAVGRFVQDVVGTLPVLPYDAAAARIHAELRHSRERAGFTLPFVDGQIASVAVAHGLTLVTRNTKDFAELTGLRLANWFGL
ncbi:PIN domain-containing protein [Cupriavidus necator]